MTMQPLGRSPSQMVDAAEEKMIRELDVRIAKSALFTLGEQDPSRPDYTPNVVGSSNPDARALMGDDPRLRKMPEKPTEDVWIHRSNPKEGKVKPNTHGRREQPFIPISIQQLGVSGLIGFLEKGDTWSGRGEYSSLEDQLQKVRTQNRERRHAFREKMKLDNRMEQAQKRRKVLGIPLVPVGIQLAKGERTDE